MVDSINRLVEKIDVLTVRERVVIMIGILAVLFMLWDMLLLGPLENRQKLISSELKQKQANQAALNVQIQKVISENRKDPNKQLEQQLADLKRELSEVSTEVQTSTARLVAPKDMAGILESVLREVNGITLLGLKGLGARALITQEAGKNGDDNAGVEKPSDAQLANAYKHGLRIEFEGDYLSTLNYLRELEALKTGFLWDSLEFRVEEYPRSHASIQVYTLSLDKNWIDV
ncbi:MAG TPA: hypothetical protein VLN56_03070 [Gammaproteobacteria bacterium]|nr:hypothetical protein [Gammaproteobacteria bacterium]